MIRPLRLLRWLYLGRMTLAVGIFLGALLIWPTMAPTTTLVVTLTLLSSLAVTAVSLWHSHGRRSEPGRNFLYGQVLFDVLLVTVVVHLTGGSASDFAPLYILVIVAGSLLLPLPGGVLIGALASILLLRRHRLVARGRAALDRLRPDRAFRDHGARDGVPR